MKGKRDGMGEANRFKPPGTRIRIEPRHSRESGIPILDWYAAPPVKVALGPAFAGTTLQRDLEQPVSRAAKHPSTMNCGISSIVPNLSAFICVRVSLCASESLWQLSLSPS